MPAPHKCRGHCLGPKQHRLIGASSVPDYTGSHGQSSQQSHSISAQVSRMISALLNRYGRQVQRANPVAHLVKVGGRQLKVPNRVKLVGIQTRGQYQAVGGKVLHSG
jgi:hypothetical protein